MRTFTASTSTTVKIVTIVIVILAIGFAVTAFQAEDDAKFLVIPTIVLAVAIGVSYYCSIRSYEIADGKLIIQRPFDVVSVPIAGIQNAEAVDRKSLRWTVRTFGIGGLFSYTGEFWNKKFGSMTWYVTRMDKAVLITDARNKKIVVSPDDTNQFIRVLKN